MKTGLLIKFLFAALLCMGSATPAFAKADHAKAEPTGTDHGAIAQESLTKVIAPGYEAFAEDAKQLKEKTDALCADPSEAALIEARASFAKTVRQWSAVEIFQFGPITHKQRYERLFFWPDRKGLGLRQIKRALAGKDKTVTEVSSLAKKSVALQGLPALEFLLYGTGAQALTSASDDGAYRCRFAATVASNIKTLSQEVADAWALNAPFAKKFLSPSADGPLYQAPKDVTLELSKAFSSGIERVRDQKLGRTLGESAQRARPRLAPFWRSGLTFPNMAGNLGAVRVLFVEGGFADVVAAQSPGVEKSTLFDLYHAIGVLEDEKEPIAEAVKEPAQRAKLEALRVSLKSANDTASELIAEGAGLSFGFNATDGD